MYSFEGYMEAIRRDRPDLPEARFKYVEDVLNEAIREAARRGEGVLIGGPADMLRVHADGSIECWRPFIRFTPPRL